MLRIFALCVCMLGEHRYMPMLRNFQYLCMYIRLVQVYTDDPHVQYLCMYARLSWLHVGATHVQYLCMYVRLVQLYFDAAHFGCYAYVVHVHVCQAY